MKFLNDCFIIAWLNILPFFRNPFLILGVLTTITFPVFIITMSGGITIYGYLGALVAGIAHASVATSNDLVLNREFLKFQDMLVASTVNPLAYAMGIAISALIQALPLTLVFGVIMFKNLLLLPIQILLIGIILILTWISMALLAFIVATYIGGRQIGTISTVLSTVFIYIPPVYYPISVLPVELKWVAYIVPTTHAAELMRITTGVTFSSNINTLFHWISLVFFVILFIMLTLKKARWREV